MKKEKNSRQARVKRKAKIQHSIECCGSKQRGSIVGNNNQARTILKMERSNRARLGLPFTESDARRIQLKVLHSGQYEIDRMFERLLKSMPDVITDGQHEFLQKLLLEVQKLGGSWSPVYTSESTIAEADAQIKAGQAAVRSARTVSNARRAELA